jgi:hypothetical protein
VTGLFFIKPASERVAAEMDAEGGRLTPKLRADIRKLIVTARVDYVTFALVVFDMVAKPTGDEAGVLVAMGVILLIGIAYIVVSVRAIEADSARAPAAA